MHCKVYGSRHLDGSMNFYQYRRSDNLNFSMLRHGEIYFASASELNDANECRPHLIFRGSMELWQRLADYILFHACAELHSNHAAGMAIYSSRRHWGDVLGKILRSKVKNKDVGVAEFAGIFSEALRQIAKGEFSERDIASLDNLAASLISKLPQQLREERYIASFSRNATDPTMWGHYAGIEKGYLIVYETENNTVMVHSPLNTLTGSRTEEFGRITIGSYKEEVLELEPVKYRMVLPKVNAFHGLIPRFLYSEEEDHYDVPAIIAGDAPSKHQDMIGLIKYSSWRYEREIRAFFPTHSTLPPDLRSLAVDARHIKGLVFGPNMSDSDKGRAILCCYLFREECSKLGRNRPENISFFQAKHNAERFRLGITPVGVLSDHFHHSLPFTPIRKCDPSVVERLTEIARSIEFGK